MRDWHIWGAVAGVVAPPLLLSVVLVLTVIEWPFLRKLGWSGRERNEVGWPSILALGESGWLLVVALAASGVLGLAFAAALYHAVPAGAARVAALLLGAVAVGLIGAAFPADPPGATAASWHDRIHNYVYPVIPLGSIAGAALIAWGLWDHPRWSGQARLALGALLVIIPAFILTGVASIGQLSRYVLFGALLSWLELLAVATLDAAQER